MEQISRLVDRYPNNSELGEQLRLLYSNGFEYNGITILPNNYPNNYDLGSYVRNIYWDFQF